MTLDSRMAATALKLITKRGKTITYTRITQGAYGPATGASSTTTSTSTFKALVSDFSRVTDGMAFLSGLIIEGDKSIKIAASSLAFEPTPGDKVTVGSNIYTVQNVRTVLAGESACLYELRGRT